MNRRMWERLKKMKLTSFTDKTGKKCWSFYYNDLKKLFDETRNKRAERSNAKMIDAMFTKSQEKGK